MKSASNIFDLMKTTDSHEVMFFEEPSVSLRAIVAVNNTILGPALATCRLFNFEDIDSAVNTALNMAYYNTYRSALLRRNFGGGSIVLWGDPKKVKSEMYFRSLGIFINKLNGNLFLARSSGISYADMLDIKRESDYLLGLDENYKNTNNSPVEAIAKGMIHGMKAALKDKYDAATLNGVDIVVQGVGEVGSNLVKGLLNEGANITITDLVYDKIKVIQDEVPNIKVVKPQEIYNQKCDIFCSCAYNYSIDKKNINELNCNILTGSVNAILSDSKLIEVLKEKNISYIPGYIINTGEIIQLSNEKSNNSPERVDNELSEIYYTTLNILKQAKTNGQNICDVALDMAQKYIKDVATIKMLK